MIKSLLKMIFLGFLFLIASSSYASATQDNDTILNKINAFEEKTDLESAHTLFNNPKTFRELEERFHRLHDNIYFIEFEGTKTEQIQSIQKSFDILNRAKALLYRYFTVQNHSCIGKFSFFQKENPKELIISFHSSYNFTNKLVISSDGKIKKIYIDPENGTLKTHTYEERYIFPIRFKIDDNSITFYNKSTYSEYQRILEYNSSQEINIEFHTTNNNHANKFSTSKRIYTDERFLQINNDLKLSKISEYSIYFQY